MTAKQPVGVRPASQDGDTVSPEQAPGHGPGFEFTLQQR